MSLFRLFAPLTVLSIVLVPPLPAKAASGPPQIDCRARIGSGSGSGSGRNVTFRRIRYKVRGNILSVAGISGSIRLSRLPSKGGRNCWGGKANGRLYGFCAGVVSHTALYETNYNPVTKRNEPTIQYAVCS